MLSFTISTRIASTKADAFDLARNVDAHLRSLDHSNERAIGGVTTGLMELDDEVTWRATHFGIPFRMTSRITEFDRPDRFVDEQVRGPFGWFRHVHRFTGEDGDISMIDEVEFESPFGPVGRFVDATVLGRYLEQLLRTRADALRIELEAQ